MNPARPPSARGPVLAALALMSAAATAQQIALMQVLGWMHWHHFAYLIVAVALLGFGIAGTTLSLTRATLVNAWSRLVPWLLVIAALAMPLGPRLAQARILAVDLPLVFFEPANTWRLVLLCLLLLPPFFCAGLMTGVLLTRHARDAGRTYAASLAGAGLGGVVGLALIAGIEPPRLCTGVALLPLIAAGCLWPLLSRILRMATAVTAALLVALWLFPGDLQLSQFKPLSRTLDLPGAQVVAGRSGVHGWVQVVRAPALRPAPAVSLQFEGGIPVQPAVFVNGLSYGSLPGAAALDSPAWLEHTTDAAAFAITRPRRVLLLENGPGGWTALARRHGATHINVVEPNGALVDLLAEEPDPLAPEWRLPGVTRTIATGRTELGRPGDAYDLIRFPTIGALGGTAGLGSASEQFLLTREAFIEAWRRAAPGGILAVTAWMDFPERNPLRLIATLAEALETEAATPRAHLAAVRGWAAVTLLARKPAAPEGPAWSVGELATLRAFCADRGFDPLLLPDLAPGEREQNHAWQNPRFFTLVDALVDGPRQPVYQEYEFELRPATDARPYFSQFLRWSGWDRLKETFGARSMPFFELGSWVVALTFVLLLALAACGIALPLLRLGWRAPGKARVLLYFSGLGAGYMFAEIGLMLRAHALLGHPVLAAGVVLTGLLVASGVGSLCSDRIPATTAAQRRVTASVVVGLLAVSAVLALLTPHARAWPAAASVALLLVLVMSLGSALGMAFPLGLRWLEAHAPDHLPWAWAVNGCISVATPAGAMLLAMRSGFGALFAAAAIAYGVALCATLLSGASATRSPSAPG